MLPSLAVIIPALNEERAIVESVASAFAAGAVEVFVCDGGSTDQTVQRAEAAGARVLLCAPMRSKQMNVGAQAATAENLLFLHADSLAPDDSVSLVHHALESALFGGFRIRFSERNYKLRIVEKMINLRTTLTRCPWGDQGQFISRREFMATGGFLEIPLMEDFEMAERMKRKGRTVVLQQTVTTSGRRFLRFGILRTTTLNWSIIAQYKAGRDPFALAARYRKSKPSAGGVQ